MRVTQGGGCVVFLLVSLLGGCATTLSTWERAALMTRVMQDPLQPGAARFETHVLDTREAMAGASDAGGAPCGCN